MFQIIKHRDGKETVLAEGRVHYAQFVKYPMKFTLCGNKLEASFGDVTIMAEDKEGAYLCGAAGYVAVSYTHLDVYKRQVLRWR